MKTFQVPGGPVLPLMDIRGKDYLVVAYRLVWFRHDHPDWAINTHLEPNIEKKYCIAQACISDASGKVIATAHKMETESGFSDYIEKSETGAVGRALAMCGYGTQFAPELDEGERIVDAPLESPKPAPTSKPGGSSAFCDSCDTELVISKSGAGYYCPQFKTPGEHTRFKAEDLESFKNARQDVKS